MIRFDLRRIEAELRAVFPSLSIPSPLIVIGSGFNSTVIEAGGAMIFRIGKNSRARQGYEKEAACLPLLTPNIPFLIPDPKGYVKSAAYFPYGVISYAKIQGIPLNPYVANDLNSSLLADDTARFLLALHQVPLDSLPLEETIDSVSKWEGQYQEVLPILTAELAPTELRRIQQWWDDLLSDKKMKLYNPVIQHGDLWYENILVDNRMEKLIGIVDWERLSIGDPAQDFATLFHTGDKFVKQVIHAYQSMGGELDENFEHRMQRLWEAREFDGLYYAVQFDDPIELSDALYKLRQGPILKRSMTGTKEK